MKGIVFREFTDMVEQKFGLARLNQIIRESDLPSGAAYTHIGTYDPDELVQLLTRLSKAENIPTSRLLEEFGQHMFHRFTELYPQLLSGIRSSFDLFEHLEEYIHPEVKKLYPDAELPHFSSQRLDDGALEFVYSSQRALSDLALGLMKGAAAYYEENISISKEDLSNGKGTQVRFIIRKK